MATLAWMAQDEKTPEELALEGFDPKAGAMVVNVEYRQYDDDLVAQFGDLGHAVVQIGFPGRTAYYYTPFFHYPDGWHRELPPEGDPRRHPLTDLK